MPEIIRTLKLTGTKRVASTQRMVAPNVQTQTPDASTQLDFELAPDAPERYAGPATITFVATSADGDLGALALDGEWTLTLTQDVAKP